MSDHVWEEGRGISPLMIIPLITSSPLGVTNQEPNCDNVLCLQAPPSLTTNTTTIFETDDCDPSVIKANTLSHPHCPRLLSSYVCCHKVATPPEVVARLEEACALSLMTGSSLLSVGSGEDPALDQFMEAYCEILSKYEQELSKPFKEALLFLSHIDSQLKSLSPSLSPPLPPPPGTC